MKILLITIGFYCLAVTGMAQEFQLKFPATPGRRIKLENLGGHVRVMGYAGTEIMIRFFPGGNRKIQTTTTPVNTVYALGTDNTGVGLFMEKDTGEISFKNVLPLSMAGDYLLKIPEKLLLSVVSDCHHLKKLNIVDMQGDLDIRICHAVTIENAEGAIVLTTIAGKVDVRMRLLQKGKPVSIISETGNITLTIPPDVAADLRMGSAAGTVHCDFPVLPGNNKKTLQGDNQISGRIGSGGAVIHLQSLSGRIFLQKSKP
ncbi:MAG TPA: DUF4097 family beta strand repeat-containing protein [Chitinophagaceae bacterium]|jgi:hypothetical protein